MKVGLVIGLLVAAFAVPSSAAAAAPVLACGATVTTNVTLTADLLNCPVDGLVVGASGITINLNGHKITGTSGAGPFDPVLCLCGVNDRDGYSDVTLRGGLIEGFVEGAQFGGAHDITVRNLIAKGHWDDGVFFDRVVRALVTNSTMVGDYRGVEADGSRNVVVRDTTVVNIQHAGVALFFSTDSVVRNVTADMGLGDYGVEVVNSSHNLVTQNLIRNWGFDGILLAGATGSFVGNLPAEENAIVENRLRNGTGFGIEVIESDAGVARNNLVALNSILGTVPSSSPQPDGSGIEVDAVISADGQGNPPYQYLTGPGPSGTRIKDNVSNGNALDGIHLEAAGNLIAGNVTNRNSNWGIYAVSGNTDGGGNHATGNGRAAQCRGVRCAP